MIHIRQRFSLLILAMSVFCISNNSIAQTPEEIELTTLQTNINRACPKQWEEIYSDIHLNPNVLDIWQSDLTDKAQFVQYVNEFLLDENGNLLIDSYSDAITVMTECASQRVTYYKTIREHLGASIGHLISKLNGQTAFDDTNPASGVDYDEWLSEIPNPLGDDDVPINLAIGRFTSQSATTSEELENLDPDIDYTTEQYSEMAENQGYAVRAVDDNQDGIFANGSVTYTGMQDQPYWQVDLEDVSLIDSITIYNRTDCCQTRFSGFSVFVSTVPFDTKTFAEAQALQGSTTIVNNLSFLQNEGSKTITPTEKPQGRYVRIQLAGLGTALSIAEVVIMGTVVPSVLD